MTSPPHKPLNVRRRDSNQKRFCGLLLVIPIVILLCPDSAQTQKRSQRHLQFFRDQHRRRYQEFQVSLELIARFCDERNLKESAAGIRQLLVPVDLDSFRLDSLPRNVQPKISLGLPEDKRRWRTQLRFAQNKYAKDLYLLSRRALTAAFPSYAYEMLHEVAVHDPDHKSARRLLGYERVGNEWMTPFAASMLRRRYEWHDTFGWLPNGHCDKYEQGLRYYNRRWISAARDKELHRDFRHAWQIRTDHYLIKTNVSLERAVELGKALEEFHRFFHQMFAAFFNTPEQLRKLFEGRTVSGSHRAANRPYEVHYYAIQEEYIQRLKNKIEQIEITNGLYFPDDRVAYFYHDPQENNEATLFHEATHQLFYETQPHNRRIGKNQNFWIVEGIACYMESFRRDNGRFTVGGRDYIRFQAARYRLLNDGYYLPLEQLTKMGMQEFQTHRSIRKNYSQSSGLAHFFMHYDGGRYRDALIEHLSQLYNTGQRVVKPVQSLAALCGVGFAELDRQYADHLKTMQKAIPQKQVEGD